LGHLCDIEADIANSIRAGAVSEMPGEFRDRFSTQKDEAAISGMGKDNLIPDDAI